jgi:hypothetical protein
MRKIIESMTWKEIAIIAILVFAIAQLTERVCTRYKTTMKTWDAVITEDTWTGKLVASVKKDSWSATSAPKKKVPVN